MTLKENVLERRKLESFSGESRGENSSKCNFLFKTSSTLSSEVAKYFFSSVTEKKKKAQPGAKNFQARL